MHSTKGALIDDAMLFRWCQASQAGLLRLPRQQRQLQLALRRQRPEEGFDILRPHLQGHQSRREYSKQKRRLAPLGMQLARGLTGMHAGRSAHRPPMATDKQPAPRPMTSMLQSALPPRRQRRLRL